jgi:formate hydrogenlyase subunit 3/multisubunit Na+/H+ antiporter MnhD subunit
MSLLLVALGLFGLGALAALAAARSAVWATRLGVGAAVAGAAAGLVPAARVAFGGAAAEAVRVGWDVPYGSLYLELDTLSAYFLLPILGVSALVALYGGAYLLAYRERRSLGAPWFFFNLLVAAMALVVLARNGVLFLVAWEVMSLASFFLVTFENEKDQVCQAGWNYLVATHLGTAFLLALFILLGQGSGSLDFDRVAASGAPASAGGAGLLFLLAVVGFGTKAGFMPLHVWLPEAHPAAPSHVSAVMSAVMIKTGIYGLLRTLTLLGPPEAWWGWLLIAVGTASAILGILYALAQQDLKRLLAYSSVENVGIITLGVGIGLVGLSSGGPRLAALGFAGALLHLVNHALFKSLLFLGAGVVLHGTGTRNLDRLGGLLKRMPQTGALFLLGAVAITGLPPLNGFVSELLIYLATFQGAIELSGTAAIGVLAVVPALALVGGLTAACFSKAFGIAFLGEARSEASAHAHEAGVLLRLPLFVLAAGCVFLGPGSPLALRALEGVVQEVTRLPAGALQQHLGSAADTLSKLAGAAALLLALVAALTLLRRALLAGRAITKSVTWDCGYARPTARMQYSSSSFAQPLTDLFGDLLRTRRRVERPAGLLPRSASLSTSTPDLFQEDLYRLLFRWIDRGLSKLRWLQHGRLQLYVLYIALTMLVLLVWKLG